MADSTRAQKKLISYLKQKDPNLTEKQLLEVLSGIKRFVDLTRKIYTEPQAVVSYKDTNINGKIQKNRIFTTNMQELSKLIASPSEDIKEVMEKFHKSVTKKKHE